MWPAVSFMAPTGELLKASQAGLCVFKQRLILQESSDDGGQREKQEVEAISQVSGGQRSCTGGRERQERKQRCCREVSDWAKPLLLFTLGLNDKTVPPLQSLKSLNSSEVKSSFYSRYTQLCQKYSHKLLR